MADNNANTIRTTDQQRVKEITDKLEEGLKELFESEKYKSYLNTMSKFHNYSFNNTLLIAMQKPEVEITLTVAECGEFHNMGEFYENILTHIWMMRK